MDTKIANCPKEEYSRLLLASQREKNVPQKTIDHLCI